MKPPLTFTLAALLVGCLSHTAHAQYGYPYPPASYGYPQPMGYVPMPYGPMPYGGYGQQAMPVTGYAQPMVMPVMVPVVVDRVVPMLGPVETMPQAGPLDSAVMNAVAAKTAPAPVVPPSAVIHTVAKPKEEAAAPPQLASIAAAQQPTPAGQKVSVEKQPTKHWYSKVYDKYSRVYDNLFREKTSGQ